MTYRWLTRGIVTVLWLAALLPGCSKTDKRARRYDAVRGCWEDFEVVGETRGNQVCTTALVLAQGPDGACYYFTNGCLPRGFEQLDGDHGSGCAVVAPSCSDCTDAGCPADD